MQHWRFDRTHFRSRWRTCRWALPDAGDGAKFLDRDPDIFNVVLKCLRNPALDVRAVATDMGVSVTAVSAEIEFLGLQTLLTCRSRRWTTWPIP